MPRVTYIQHDGERSDVDVSAGTSIMKAAIANDVDGIIGDCGGSLACATCHVYVEQVSPGQFPAAADEEDEMLEETACERLPNSRLSCQLTLTDDIDQAVVRLPEEQW
jgi:2Fe-2S ferredoxin